MRLVCQLMFLYLVKKMFKDHQSLPDNSSDAGASMFLMPSPGALTYFFYITCMIFNKKYILFILFILHLTCNMNSVGQMTNEHHCKIGDLRSRSSQQHETSFPLQGTVWCWQQHQFSSSHQVNM